MVKIDDSNRHYLKKLCSCRKDDTMLLWFLEGNPYCDAWVDDVVHPEEAVIIAADFCYLLGEVKHLDEIEQTLEENARYKVIIPCGLLMDAVFLGHMRISRKMVWGMLYTRIDNLFALHPRILHTKVPLE